MSNPPRPTPGYLRAWRDHRKLIVQDRTRLVAGGLCVADVWLGNCVRRCTWRDSAVFVEGGEAPHAAEEFDRLWQDGFALTWRRGRAKAPPSLPQVAYVIVCSRSGASWLKVSQMTPSVSCWTPNSSGIIARGCSVLASVFLSAAAPIAESDVPAMKLAEAEKHMERESLTCSRASR